MKKLCMTLVVLIAAIAGYGQTFTLGPKVGINYSKVAIDENFNSNGINFDYITKDAKVGFVAGGFMRLNFDRINIQPEVLLSQETSTVELSSNAIDEVQTIRYTKFDVPLLMGYNIGESFRVQAGPVRTKVINATVKDDDFWTAVDESDKATWGAQFGVGFDIDRVGVDLRYETNLSRFGSEFQVGNQTMEFDQRRNIFQITIGYKIFD